MLISKLLGFSRLQLRYYTSSDERSVFIKALSMLHCKVVFVLTILTFWKVFAIIHYGIEDGGILLQLPSHLWKTLSLLSYKNALVYLSVSGDS